MVSVFRNIFQYYDIFLEQSQNILAFFSSISAFSLSKFVLQKNSHAPMNAENLVIRLLTTHENYSEAKDLKEANRCFRKEKYLALLSGDRRSVTSVW